MIPAINKHIGASVFKLGGMILFFRTWRRRFSAGQLVSHFLLLAAVGCLLFVGKQWWWHGGLAAMTLSNTYYSNLTTGNLTTGRGGERGLDAVVPGKVVQGTPSPKLRILIQQRPRSMDHLVRAEKEMIRQYAEYQGLIPQWIEVRQPEQLFTYLAEGRGDVLIAAKEGLPDALRRKIRFTIPWGRSRQQVVVRSGTGRMARWQDLVTRQVAVKKSSPALPILEAQAARHPGMDITIIPEHIDVDTVLRRVESGQYDVTVMDSVVLAPHLSRYLHLEGGLYLTQEKTMAWAVRADVDELHASLNRFLNKKYLESNVAQRYREDLPSLQARGRLRLITYQSPVNYFIEGGRLKGFEYELIKRFAEQNRMRLDVVIAESHGEMQALLTAGRGDIIAASLPAASYTSAARIHYTKPYSHAAPIVVGNAGDAPLLDVRDLDGRRIVLPPESPYRSTLERIRARGIDVEIVDAPPQLNMEATLFRVAQGIYDLTVIGGQQLKPEFARQLNLQAHFPLQEPLPNTWVVRQADTQLLSALNDYIDNEFRRGFYNVLFSRYIDRGTPGRGSPRLLDGLERLSPYDELVHRYAERYGFDWRLIIAQMYQESHFDPDALSYAGAEGLMQILPSTGRELGAEDLNDPDISIHAGIRYLAHLRDSFEDELLMEDRTWFTLAAYNAGYQRVKQARALAGKMGLRQDLWFDNVEKAMLALSRPYRREGKMVRLCRCGQTVIYVREIKTLYSNYTHLTPSVKMAAARLGDIQDS